MSDLAESSRPDGPPPLCSECESKWRAYARYANDPSQVMGLLSLADGTPTVRLEARLMGDTHDAEGPRGGGPPGSSTTSVAGDFRDDVSVDTCETRRRITALEEALERAASTPVLATEGADSVEGLQSRLERAGLASLRSAPGGGPHSGAASPAPRSPRSVSGRRGASPTRRPPAEFRGFSSGGSTTVDIVVATTLASQRAALERRERGAAEREAVVKKAARELQRTRADIALKQAQLENAVIEFQKREAELARGEAELVQQRRMLRHHRDNEMRVRTAMERARGVSASNSYVGSEEFEIHSDPEDGGRRRNGTPARRDARYTTPSRRRSATPRGTVRSPAYATPPPAPDTRRHPVYGAATGDESESAVAQAEQIMQLTEAMIDRERAALRQEIAAARTKLQRAMDEASRRLDDAGRTEASIRGVAQDLQLVLNAARASPTGFELAAELCLLQRRVEAALGVPPSPVPSTLTSRATSRSPNNTFHFDDDL